MSTTVFCTFDQQDLADLAIGKLRGSINGINGVTYLQNGSVPNDEYRFVSGWGLFSAANYTNAGISPSRPVSVRITCDENVKDKVISKLLNLHAYRITSN